VKKLHLGDKIPAMPQMTIEQAMQLAMGHYQAGRPKDAERACRQALAIQPGHSDALHLLGVIAGQAGRAEDAEKLIRQAISLAPSNPSFHFNLGTFQHQWGQLDKAIDSYQRAVMLKADFAEAHYNLGSSWHSRGSLDRAIESFLKALAIRPDYAEAHISLGNALRDAGRIEEAAVSYRRALAIKPDFVEGHNNLGAIQAAMGQLDQAIASYRQALAMNPNLIEAHVNLGAALADKGQFEEAVASYEQALARKPDYASAHYNMGNALKDTGRQDEAVACYRKALACNRNYVEVHNNLLMTMLFQSTSDSRSLLVESENWNRRHAEPLKRFIQPHENNRDPERRIRVGYVSPDFRNHPVGRFVLPLLARHDPLNFEIVCYSQVSHPDKTTAELRAHANAWRNIAGLNDADVAELIRQDRIDILVDLSMHTANNRLLAFARKPAPIQVSYLAYASFPALETIDYYLTDRYLEPDESKNNHGFAKPIRLDGTYWCYQPAATAGLITELPALKAGRITVGCLNNFSKVTPIAMETWAEVLREIPGSYLLCQSPPGAHRQNFVDFFSARGITADRLEIVERVQPQTYFTTYQRIDIALDTFPYAGGTTTCDALWMGVPVVTLAGRTSIARAGVSILSNAGLPELIAHDPEEYARRVIDLASDLPRLAKLRSTLRRRLEGSSLMDAPRYARDVENAYRTMWRTWCAK
jgi:protein O-GlcNAc transferase